jgi:hypothetical protein
MDLRARQRIHYTGTPAKNTEMNEDRAPRQPSRSALTHPRFFAYRVVAASLIPTCPAEDRSEEARELEKDPSGSLICAVKTTV